MVGVFVFLVCWGPWVDSRLPATDSSGKNICTIMNSQADDEEFFSDCLSLESGPHKIYRNVGNEPLTYTTQHPRTSKTSSFITVIIGVFLGTLRLLNFTVLP